MSTTDETATAPTPREVAGWVAVVTGAASGIGLGTATRFAEAGMKVVLSDVDGAALDRAATALADAGHQVAAVTADVSKRADNEALADAAEARFGPVNVFFANAGVGLSNPVWETSPEDWRWIIDVDLWGPIHGLQVFLPRIMATGTGHVVATASMAGLLAGASLGAYNVAKHGVVALMASAARDLMVARSPITASVLCPGPINTAITDSDRNRPAELGTTSARVPQAERQWSSLNRALAHGMDPGDVGALVLDAVRTARFWVFTHPEMTEMVAAQLELARTTGGLQKF
jgi:NAD(P)-dependent dehydrogenase (short-subunit alcohol dehydrogenase family)